VQQNDVLPQKLNIVNMVSKIGGCFETKILHVVSNTRPTGPLCGYLVGQK
jgi:hypothetical protein